jgi:protein-disulfide isomerase
MLSRESILNAMVGVSMLCAVVVTGDVLLRRFQAPAQSARGGPAVTEVKDWKDYAAVGQRIGPPTARVTLVEFGDFECPVCRHFATGALRMARASYPGDLQVVFRHYPLRYHKQAYPAARAAECAANQGAFEAFHDSLFATKDSLGNKSFHDIAVGTGVRDLVAFDACYSKTDSLPTISRDIAAADRLKIRGTPALLINGKLYGGALDSAGLFTAIKKELANSRH